MAALILSLLITMACTKKAQSPILVNVPTGFTGQVHLELGELNAPALPSEQGCYVVTLPPDGIVRTSSVIDGAVLKFQNLQPGKVWGYTAHFEHAGDGIPLGGDIQFFVGTAEQYKTAEAKKHHSRRLAPSSEGLEG
jgi:hypothetical protein